MKNLHKKILVIMFVGLVLAMPIATFATMPKEAMPFSENENRFLDPFLKPDLVNYFRNFFNKKSNNIKDKRFMNRFDTWIADRFVSREDWIVLQNNLELLQGKDEINGVFTEDDRMMQVWRADSNALKDTDETLKSVNKFAGEIREMYGIESYVMLIPSAQEIYADTLPPNAHIGNQAALIKHCYDNMENLSSIDAMTYLAEKSGSYIFYRTDHHWTSYGAYWGYYAAAKKLGLTPYDLGHFDVEHASSDFRGTLFSKTLNFSVSPDVIAFYTLSATRAGVRNPEIKLTINDGTDITEHDSLYLRDYLESKDKYAAFMGQNSPIMEVETNADSEESLLVFKDSFAHSMLPFLTNHYKRLTVLDMRYINSDIHDFVDLDEYSQVLFVYGATIFAEDGSLRKLGRAK